MPTILRTDGLRVSIFPNDHPPSHVHVFAGGGEALLYLNCPSGPASLRTSYRLNERELKRIREALQPDVPQLCADWKEIHGEAQQIS